jgi:hypothetical protein
MSKEIENLASGDVDAENDKLFIDSGGTAKSITLASIAQSTPINIRDSSKTSWHFIPVEYREPLNIRYGFEFDPQSPTTLGDQETEIAPTVENKLTVPPGRYLHIQFDVGSASSLDGRIPDGTRRVMLMAHAKNITLKTRYRMSNRVIFDADDSAESVFIFILENVQDLRLTELESPASVSVSYDGRSANQVYGAQETSSASAIPVEIFPNVRSKKWGNFSGELIDWHNNLGPERMLLEGELTRSGLIPNSTGHANLDPINKISATLQTQSSSSEGIFYNAVILAWSF